MKLRNILSRSETFKFRFESRVRTVRCVSGANGAIKVNEWINRFGLILFS